MFKRHSGLFQSKTVSFELPNSASTEGSKCDKKSPILKLTFGEGHTWSVNFTKKDESYQADIITFAYNLNDSKVFPDTSDNGNLYLHLIA